MGRAQKTYLEVEGKQGEVPQMTQALRKSGTEASLAELRHSQRHTGADAPLRNPDAQGREEESEREEERRIERERDRENAAQTPKGYPFYSRANPLWLQFRSLQPSGVGLIFLSSHIFVVE
ncbi:hypothetical protein LR48_Vigan07g038900 [Vigna angularis]|uniref:Uncharacterized protein n=1 Tax=Phaseolus angularis TaxID=3914 RepID=A0A0L9UUY9_PHAAN|nr:hypothetical protein LR48_Vigan07g038900 [Vigna angularis]